MNGAAILRGDSLRLPLRDESVDLVVTSPPYFALRSYQDQGEHYGGQIGSEDTPGAFLAALWAVLDECWRVLKPSGSVFVDLGDKYAGSGVLPKSLMLLPEQFRLGAIDPGFREWKTGVAGGPQWIARAVIVWDKPNGLPESVTDRVRRSHEDWVHLTKRPRYFAAVDEVREPHAEPQRPGVMTWEQRRGRVDPAARYSDQNGHGGTAGMAQNPLGKLPGSVWDIASEPLRVPDWLGVDHFAAFPQEWPRRLILGWSPSGICTACGDPRRAVVEKERVGGWNVNTAPPRQRDRGSEGSGGERVGVFRHRHVDATITGYACLCPDTSAPTRPAVVLDPFAGTGTTVMVARALGRYGVGVDLSADYLRLARWRVWQSGHAAKSNARTWDERQEVLL